MSFQKAGGNTSVNLFDAVETAVFHAQCRSVKDVALYLRNVHQIRNVDWSEIDRLVHAVATQYKNR